MLATGIRVGALAQYTVGDAIAAIRTQRFVIRGDINKRGTRCDNLLTREAEQALKDLLNLREDMGGDNRQHDEQLIIGMRGPKAKQGMTARAYQLALKKWAYAADLSCAAQVSPHWLRHTLGKEIMRQSTAKNPLQIVQAVFGHKDLNSTGVYTRPDKEMVDAGYGSVRI
jgi:site-specific recombinase XerD